MALLPTGVFLTVQYAFIIFVMVLVTAFIAIGSPGMDAGALGQSASELLLGSVMDIQVIAQLLTLLVTAPWFFFAFVYKKKQDQDIPGVSSGQTGGHGDSEYWILSGSQLLYGRVRVGAARSDGGL